jgi:hypothetical protein
LNSPFYAKGVSYLDEVRLRDYELPPNMDRDDIGRGFFEFDNVLKRSGHGTVRAILRSEELKEMAEAAVEETKRLGCTSESTGNCLVSIDIPPCVGAATVMAANQRAGSDVAKSSESSRRLSYSHAGVPKGSTSLGTYLCY